MTASFSVRPRVASDLEACERLLAQVHALDGYPPYLPDHDFRHFLVSEDGLAAWVAHVGDRVVGHIALHASSSGAVMDLAVGALQVPAERLAVVARLLVGAGDRRAGIGRRLLEVAAEGARGRSLGTILDVAHQFEPAIRLYEASGWQRLGSVRARMPDGTVIDEFVYVLPTSIP